MLTRGDKAHTRRHSPCPPASARWPGRSPRSLCGACISGSLLWKTSLPGRECSHSPHLWCHSHRTGQGRGQRTQVSTGSHLPGPSLQSWGTPRDGHTRPIRHSGAPGALGTDVLGTTCRATQSMVTIPHEGPGGCGLAARQGALPGTAPPPAHTGDTHGTTLWSGCSTHSRRSCCILLWLSTSETPATRKGSLGFMPP